MKQQRLIRAIFTATLMLLPLQLVLIATLSEPYPGVIGPLFMGNRDLGEGVLNYRQDFLLRHLGTGEEVRLDPAQVMGLGDPYAMNIRTFRFPLGPVDASGRLTSSPTLREQLASQGHKFRPTPFHRPLSAELTEEERSWLRARLPVPVDASDQRLVVRWVRELYALGPQGEVLRSEEPLNEYLLQL